MPIECEIRDGRLVWVRNPVTGAVSYVVDVRGKSFAYTLGNRAEPAAGGTPLSPEIVRRVCSECPFCPGNEDRAPRELMRMTPQEVFGPLALPPELAAAPWLIRIFNNLFPRIPEELTGNRNESYIVIEDPRHFVAEPRALDDVVYSALLDPAQFLGVLQAGARMMARILENPTVRSVVIRKNQGPESGASQPHTHQQIIGCPMRLPALDAEIRADRETGGLFAGAIELVQRVGLLLEHKGPVVTYQSPIGTFPRSYDIVMPEHRATLDELSSDELRAFARALHRLLHVLGAIPLDYEIHQDRMLPLHAHVNVRHYPYSNVAGTLNLPSTLFGNAGLLRRALEEL